MGDHKMKCVPSDGLDQHHGTSRTLACANDEARSAILYSADYGTTITLYDSPNGDRSDDYVEIKVKGYTNNPVVIGSFESTKNIMLDNGFIEVIYHRNNGLDGKVSRAEVSVFQSHAIKNCTLSIF